MARTTQSFTHSRAPHGARGLKHRRILYADVQRLSRPARGAWIETVPPPDFGTVDVVAPRTGRVD